MREITWLVGTSSNDIECVNFVGWDFSEMSIKTEHGRRRYEVAVAEDLRVFVWECDTLYVFPDLERAEQEFGEVLKKFGVREYLKSINRI